MYLSSATEKKSCCKAVMENPSTGIFRSCSKRYGRICRGAASLTERLLSHARVVSTLKLYSCAFILQRHGSACSRSKLLLPLSFSTSLRSVTKT